MNFSVYHIPDPSNLGTSFGYIGVSSNVETRFIQHSKTRSKIGDKIRSLNIVFKDVTILKTFTKSDDAYLMEFSLRPRWNIGWNVTPGGRGYQKDNKQDAYTRAKMSFNRSGKVSSNSPERYAIQVKEQIGVPRKKLICPFCHLEGGEGNMHRWHFANCKKAPSITNRVNGFDCDGVISIGIYPGPDDIIITGRSFEEDTETLAMLKHRSIQSKVYFNPIKFNEKTRLSSGIHKGEKIWELFCEGIQIVNFFEDDWIQLREIKRIIKKYSLKTQVIWINHNGLIELENVRHRGEI